MLKKLSRTTNFILIGIIVGLFVGVSIRQAFGQTETNGTARADNLTVNMSANTENGLIVANGNLLVPNGNIGIGTTTPTTSLDVVGTITASTSICIGTGADVTCITRSQLQALLAVGGTGTGDTLSIPTPVMASIKSSVAPSENFTLSWGGNQIMNYLEVNGVVRGPYTGNTYTTSFNTLATGASAYTFRAKVCNIVSDISNPADTNCSAWSNSVATTKSDVVTSTVTAGATVYNIYGTAVTTTSLTSTQIQSVQSKLSSFGASGAAIKNVNTFLSGGTPPTILYPSSLDTFQIKDVDSLIGSFGASDMMIAEVAQLLSFSFMAPAATISLSISGTTLSWMAHYANSCEYKVNNGNWSPIGTTEGVLGGSTSLLGIGLSVGTSYTFTAHCVSADYSYGPTSTVTYTPTE